MRTLLIIYNALALAVLVAGSPVFLFYAVFSKKWRSGLLMRFGVLPAGLRKKLKESRNLWLHAASAGEVKCMASFCVRLKEKFPDRNIVLSVATANGMKMAAKALPGIQAFYLPLDIWFFVKPVVKAVAPEAFIVAETEIWPSLYYAVKQQGGKIIIVNGRFSKKNLKKYIFISPLISETFRLVDAFGMRNNGDLEYLKRIDRKVLNAFVTGDLKYETVYTDPEKAEWLRADLEPYLNKNVIAAGSVHLKEAGELLAGVLVAAKSLQNLTFIVAPRFLEEAADFEALFLAAGIRTVKRSELKGNKKAGVVILDTLGELTAVYGLCGAAFVGGTLAEGIGGHNMLEPLFFGKKVIFGRFYPNFQEIGDEILAAALGVKVANGKELGEALLRVIKDSPREVSEKADSFIKGRQGSLKKNLELVEKVMRT